MCSSRCKLWVCYTCHRKLQSGTMPGECYMNKLENVEVPDVLKDLNSVERHLVSRIIPFKKMMALPKGGQFRVQGLVMRKSPVFNASTALSLHGYCTEQYQTPLLQHHHINMAKCIDRVLICELLACLVRLMYGEKLVITCRFVTVLDLFQIR